MYLLTKIILGSTGEFRAFSSLMEYGLMPLTTAKKVIVNEINTKRKGRRTFLFVRAFSCVINKQSVLLSMSPEN